MHPESDNQDTFNQETSEQNPKYFSNIILATLITAGGVITYASMFHITNPSIQKFWVGECLPYIGDGLIVASLCVGLTKLKERFWMQTKRLAIGALILTNLVTPVVAGATSVNIISEICEKSKSEQNCPETMRRLYDEGFQRNNSAVSALYVFLYIAGQDAMVYLK